MTKEVVLLCVWPCGTTCEMDELHEYTHKSDDYEIVYLTEEQYERLTETGNLP